MKGDWFFDICARDYAAWKSQNIMAFPDATPEMLKCLNIGWHSGVHQGLQYAHEMVGGAAMVFASKCGDATDKINDEHKETP